MSVLQNDNGTLIRVDLSALSQVVAVDTENILGGGAGAQTDAQTLVDQLAADDVQIKSDLLDYVDWESNAILGAHNLLEIPSSVVTMTSENTTFTVNRSGGQVTSIVANATQAGANFPTIQLLTKSQLKAIVTRPMILSGCPAGGSDATYYLVVVDSNDTVIREYGNGITLTPSMLGEGTSLGLAIQCNRGTIPNNVTFKPMLTLVEDTDKTFAPFAMTNRELTENLFYKGVIPSSADLNNITESGLYSIQNAPTHCPVSGGWCSMLVCNNGFSNYQQMIFKGADGIYVRKSITGGWDSWYKFTGTVVS